MINFVHCMWQYHPPDGSVQKIAMMSQQFVLRTKLMRFFNQLVIQRGKLSFIECSFTVISANIEIWVILNMTIHRIISQCMDIVKFSVKP